MASYLTDEDKIRSVMLLNSTQLPDANCRDPMASAMIDLKKWVGTATYATSLAEVTTARSGLSEGETLEGDGDLSVQAQALRDAETYLAIMHLVPSLNLIYGKPGIEVSVITEKGQTNALTPTQVERMVKQYKRKAANKAYDYMTNKSLSMGISRARDDSGNLIE